MQRSPAQTRSLVLAIVFAAVPILFALIRALKTGSDFRAVWMAGAAFSTAALIIALSKGRNGPASTRIGVFIFVACTLVAGFVAMLFGASAAFGVWAVALAFGFCIAAAATLLMRSAPPNSTS